VLLSFEVRLISELLNLSLVLDLSLSHLATCFVRLLMSFGPGLLDGLSVLFCLGADLLQLGSVSLGLLDGLCSDLLKLTEVLEARLFGLLPCSRQLFLALPRFGLSLAETLSLLGEGLLGCFPGLGEFVGELLSLVFGETLGGL
jgi:hypothetical protein